MVMHKLAACSCKAANHAANSAVSKVRKSCRFGTPGTDWGTAAQHLILEPGRCSPAPTPAQPCML